jgi:hypothetical protein
MPSRLRSGEPLPSVRRASNHSLIRVPEVRIAAAEDSRHLRYDTVCALGTAAAARMSKQVPSPSITNRATSDL